MLRKLLVLALLLVPGVAHAQWYEASGDHFVVYSEGRPDQLEQFAANLERFDRVMRYLRGIPAEPIGKANRVTVYMVGTFSEVGRLAGSMSAAGFYVPRAGGSLAIVPRKDGRFYAWRINDPLSPEAILLHEYAHHFMFYMGPNVAYPGWLAEGFAEFHATTRFHDDGTVEIGYVPKYRSSGIHNSRFSVEKMFTAHDRKLTYEDVQALYGRGWLLTHYLIIDENRKGQLEAYIRAIKAGKRGLEAAEVFGDLKVLQRELDSYARAKYIGIRITAGALPVGEINVRQLTAGEAATMNVRIRSKRGVGPKTAPGVYEAAKKASAPFPNDPAAQIVLAEAAYDARDYAAAEAAADRAIAADPKAVDAHVYKAMARMGIAAKAKDKSKESWAAIRKNIVAANRLDPEDPEPLILYYRSFVEADEAPPKSAIEGLRYAFVLAPHDASLRMTVAQRYLDDGDKAMARELFLRLATNPHGKGMGAYAAKMIDYIDGKGPKPEADDKPGAEEGEDEE